MSESKPSFEEMAIEEQQGVRPEENTNDEQFTMDEVKAENEKLQKAKDYVERGKQAKAMGETNQLQALNDAIASDPMMVEFMRARGMQMQEQTKTRQPEVTGGDSSEQTTEKAKDTAEAGETPTATPPQTETETGTGVAPKEIENQNKEVNLQTVKTAMSEFQGAWNRMYQISVDANAAQGTIMSIFGSGQGVETTARVNDFLKNVSKAETVEQMQSQLTELSSWFDRVGSAIENRFVAMRRYVDPQADPKTGELPNQESRSQETLFKELHRHIENMKSYMALISRN